MSYKKERRNYSSDFRIEGKDEVVYRAHIPTQFGAIPQCIPTKKPLTTRSSQNTGSSCPIAKFLGKMREFLKKIFK